MNPIRLILLCTPLFLIWGCTPKVGETTTETTTTTAASASTDSSSSTAAPTEGPCKSWNNSPKKDYIIEDHVLYKDALKEVRTERRKGAAQDAAVIDSLYNLAYSLWKRAYEAAPAADGQRADHFEDGIKIQNYFFEKSTDQAEKQKAVDEIMKLYDAREECYSEPGYVDGRKGFDYYYKYPDFATDMEKYTLFKKSLDAAGDKASYFVLNPFTAVLVNLLLEEKILMSEAQVYQQKIRTVLRNGLKDCKNPKECEPWQIVEGYAPARLEQLEGIEGFYDCDYYTAKYYAEFEAAPSNCEVISEVNSRLRWGKCGSDDAQLVAIQQAKAANCVTAPPPAGPLRLAKEALEDARFKEAIGHYEDYIAKTDDAEKKGRFTLRIARIYYVHLKSFSRAREYARKAMKHRPDWGDPLLLIGRLYASSGPLCGPGRGWDSQIVTWPAIDKWQQAKRVDPEAAAEANKFIRQYQKYMPDVEQIFQRGLKEGDSFRVGCWIQETTRIRAAKK